MNSQDSLDPDPTGEFILSEEENLEIALKIVSHDKIKWAIDSFSPFKAAGEDGIFPAILQNSYEIIAEFLFDIFLASIRLVHIPTCWREVRVVFLPKLGQSSYHQAKAFRPISLTSFQLKTLEKLIEVTYLPAK